MWYVLVRAWTYSDCKMFQDTFCHGMFVDAPTIISFQVESKNQINFAIMIGKTLHGFKATPPSPPQGRCRVCRGDSRGCGGVCLSWQSWRTQSPGSRAHGCMLRPCKVGHLACAARPVRSHQGSGCAMPAARWASTRAMVPARAAATAALRVRRVAVVCPGECLGCRRGWRSCSQTRRLPQR